MPRAPITLTPQQVQEVETLAALLNQQQIADYLGISRRTFNEIIGRDEEVAARYKRGKARAIAHVANGLLQKARAGCTTSSIFYLKTQAGWRETEKTAQAAAPAPLADAGQGVARLRAFIEACAKRTGDVVEHDAKVPAPRIAGHMAGEGSDAGA